jgi:hypothetical protein
MPIQFSPDMPKSPRRPVDARDINQRLDDLFDAKDPQRHQRTRSTICAIFRDGLDFREGHPLPRVLQHLANRFDGWIDAFHAEHPEVRVEGKAFNEGIRKAGMWVGRQLRGQRPSGRQ